MVHWDGVNYRQLIEVPPPGGVYMPDKVMVCDTCGAMVGDVIRHSHFHRDMNRLVDLSRSLPQNPAVPVDSIVTAAVNKAIKDILAEREAIETIVRSRP